MASRAMNTPRETVAITMTGGIALGSTCRSRTFVREAPSAVAAVTYSALRTEMTEPRMMRATWGQPNAASTSATTTTVLSGNACMQVMAASSSGIEKKMSVMRARKESSMPP